MSTAPRRHLTGPAYRVRRGNKNATTAFVAVMALVCALQWVVFHPKKFGSLSYMLLKDAYPVALGEANAMTAFVLMMAMIRVLKNYIRDAKMNR